MVMGCHGDGVPVPPGCQLSQPGTCLRSGSPWKAVHALTQEPGSLASPGRLLFVRAFLHKKERDYNTFCIHTSKTHSTNFLSKKLQAEI